MSERSRASELDKRPGQQSNGQTGGVTIGDVEGGIHGSIIAGRDVTTGTPIPSDRLDEQVPHSASSTGYDLAAIRKLLLAAFTFETLRRFCQERSLFRPIVAKFGPGHGLGDMVDQVTDYCETRLLWHEFLSEVAEDYPRQYARFAPYLHGMDAE